RVLFRSVVSVVQGRSYVIEVDGVSHRVERDDGGIVRSPAPAVVVSIAVKRGDSISAGDRLAVLEAMKMEMPVLAPFSGTVRTVTAIPNVQVDTGAPLLQIDPTAETEVTAVAERVAMGASGNGRPAVSACRENLNEVRHLMLGFDVEPQQTARLLANW